jgi:hypothetical protein
MLSLCQQFNSLPAMPLPRLPLPPPLKLSDPSAFIQHTLNHRWVTIARRVAAENDLLPQQQQAIDLLVQDLALGTVRLLQDDGGPEVADWQNYLTPYLDQSWRSLPWYFAEAYFYRRILEAIDYFRADLPRDPFQAQKQAELVRSGDVAIEFDALTRDRLTTLLYGSLWGNQADLSLRPTDPVLQIRAERSQLLVDDAPAVADRILAQPLRRIDWIADNAGGELISDLVAIEALLSAGATETVHLHLKFHPTFVSDATIADVQQTIGFWGGSATNQRLADRLHDLILGDRLKLRTDFFWTAPLVFWEMPDRLRQDLAQADLIVLKGDANYRRLLGDRYWSFTTAIADIACYVPAPLVALRMLKSEVLAGVPVEAIERASQEAEWLTSGSWGVIQAVSVKQ